MAKKPFPFSVCEQCCAEGGSGESIIIDAELSDTSENAVQNKVIKMYVDNTKTYIVNVTVNEDMSITADKEFSDLVEAFKNGRQILVKECGESDNYYHMVGHHHSEEWDYGWFSFVNINETNQYYIEVTDQGWNTKSALGLAKKEYVDNATSFFVVNVTIGSNGTPTADKTTAEIISAFEEGKNVIARRNEDDKIYVLSRASNLDGERVSFYHVYGFDCEVFLEQLNYYDGAWFFYHTDIVTKDRLYEVLNENIGKPDVLVVNVTIGDNNRGEADKTTSEIIQAYESNKRIIVQTNNGDIYTLCSVTDMGMGMGGEVLFSCVSGSKIRTLFSLGNAWTYAEREFATKADIGDIETALDNIITKYGLGVVDV